VCDVFIANRAMKVRGGQPDQPVLEGVPPATVERVTRDYGSAMGLLQMK